MIHAWEYLFFSNSFEYIHGKSSSSVFFVACHLRQQYVNIQLICWWLAKMFIRCICWILWYEWLLSCVIWVRDSSFFLCLSGRGIIKLCIRHLNCPMASLEESVVTRWTTKIRLLCRFLPFFFSINVSAIFDSRSF